MKMRIAACGVALALTANLPARSEAPSGNLGTGYPTVPTAISPGAIDELAGVRDACPAFSWTLLPGAEAYEMAVVEVGAAAEPSLTEPPPRDRETGRDSLVFRHMLPAGANHWIPDTTRCLARGGEYGWMVRARFSGTWDRWSEPLFFAVPGPPVIRPGPQSVTPRSETPAAVTRGMASSPVISASGLIESTAGGFKFPNGSVQSAAFRLSVYHAFVGADGSQRHGNVVATSRTSTGVYSIDLGRVAVFCSATATPGLYDPGDGAVIIPVGFAVPQLDSASSTVTVRTFLYNAATVDLPFSIHVICSPISLGL